MNGAENLLETLVASGLEICFANPGTSEMQLVSAIGNRPDMRAVLCLFEGVVAGAADGYARMADKPALTLLHLGSGFANSMANQHNAMRAHVPLVNMVGDHATWHVKYDAPLTSDVAAHAAISSSWVRASTSADDLALAGAQAVHAALQGAGKIATFIAPANHAWEAATQKVNPLPRPQRPQAPAAAIEQAAALLTAGGQAGNCALFLGGQALRENNLQLAAQIAETTGARLMCETFPARLQRGKGRPLVQRLPYFAEPAAAQLQDLDRMILIGAKAPVSFFAYPGKASWLAPEDCEMATLAEVDQDIHAALAALAQRLGLDPEKAGGADSPGAETAATATPPEPESEPDKLTPLAIGQSLARMLPENAIVVDEAATCGLKLFAVTEQAAAHDWLTLTGGAIGQGLPLSLGAALACPDRKVVNLQADGSAMYTVQALWSMAREQTDVVCVIMNNRSYAILNIELARVGATAPTPKTLSMLDLSRPDLDWVSLATGMGVPASRAETPRQFETQLAAALSQPGPHLIEALVVQNL